eukprot:6214316-Pleurochrysis_carterae.AAC.1
MRFHAFAHKEVAPVDVFRTLLVFRVIREVNRRLVVHEESGWFCGGQAEIGKERAQIDSFLGRFGGCDNFRLARRERNRRLLYAHEMAAWLYMNTCDPEVDCFVAQSESEKPSTDVGERSNLTITFVRGGIVRAALIY